VEKFVEQSGAPALFFTATGALPAAELERLAEDAERSTLPERELLVQGHPADWAMVSRVVV
jgi:hypothetical protein